MIFCFYWNSDSDGDADLDSLLDKLVAAINVDDETKVQAEKVQFDRFYFKIYKVSIVGLDWTTN